MTTGTASDIVKLLSKAQSIALFCHTNPDGDALGSMLALAHALKKTGKNADMFCDCPVPEKYKLLGGSQNISFPNKKTYDLGLSLDCSSLDRLGQCVKSFLSARKQAAVDHHASFERFAETCYVDSGASACAELVFRIVKELKALDKDVASLLFGGIVTDSGCFAFSSASAETHKIAAELINCGIDAADIIYNVYSSTNMPRFKLKNRVLSHARFFEDDRVGVIVFKNEDFDATNTSIDQTEGIINELIDIDSVRVAYALSEVRQNNYKLSIRSKSPINAAEIANYFGGGGHKNAAGCRVNGFEEDIIENIVKLARDRL